MASEASKVGLLAAAVPSSVPSSVGKGVAVSELERGDEEDDEEDEEERGGDGDNGKSVGNSAQGAVGVAVGGGGGGSAVEVVAAAASGNAGGGGTTAATNSIKDKDKLIIAGDTVRIDSAGVRIFVVSGIVVGCAQIEQVGAACAWS